MTPLGYLIFAAVICWFFAAEGSKDKKKRKRKSGGLRAQTRYGTSSSVQNASPDLNLYKGLDPDGPWQKLRQEILVRDSNKCTICASANGLTVDHIRELRFGGTNDPDNLRTLCGSCHEDRHGRKFLERGFDAKDDYGEDYKLSKKMAALSEAMLGGEGIGVKYVDRQGLYSERVLHPKKIYKARYVYIDAYDELDKEERTFRLSRMRLCESRLNFYDNATNSYVGTPWKNAESWRNGLGGK